MTQQKADLTEKSYPCLRVLSKQGFTLFGKTLIMFDG